MRGKTPPITGRRKWPPPEDLVVSRAAKHPDRLHSARFAGISDCMCLFLPQTSCCLPLKAQRRRPPPSPFWLSSWRQPWSWRCSCIGDGKVTDLSYNLPVCRVFLWQQCPRWAVSAGAAIELEKRGTLSRSRGGSHWGFMSVTRACFHVSVTLQWGSVVSLKTPLGDTSPETGI